MRALLSAQVLAVHKKNLITRFKDPKRGCLSFFEIAMPLGYSALIFFFSGQFLKGTHQPAKPYLDASSAAPLDCNSVGSHFFFAPNGTNETAAVAAVMASGLASGCTAVGYRTYEELSAALAFNDSALRADTAAAVLFELSPTTARWNFSMLLGPSVAAMLNLDPTPSGLTQYSQDTDGGRTSAWVYSGGLALQLALDRALAALHTPGAAATIGALGGDPPQFAPLPLPRFDSGYAPWAGFLMYIIPFYITWGCSSIGQYMIKPLVIERERRLPEGLMMMGLPVKARQGATLTEELGEAYSRRRALFRPRCWAMGSPRRCCSSRGQSSTASS